MRDGTYGVTLCGRCVHPGGQHWLDERYVPSDGCHLCDCPGFTVGGNGRWSDHSTETWRKARLVALAGKKWPVQITQEDR